MALDDLKELENALAELPVPVITYMIIHSHEIPFLMCNRKGMFGKPCIGLYECMLADRENNIIILDKPLNRRNRIQMFLDAFHKTSEIILEEQIILN
jgi:hypothetical protein